MREHLTKNHEYREDELEITIREKEGCGPPEDVVRSPADDAALPMHMARSPRAAVRRPARRAHRVGVAERVEE